MKKYVCIVTSELASCKDNFIVSCSLHSTLPEAVSYGEDYISSLHRYPCLADFYIYEQINSENYHC